MRFRFSLEQLDALFHDRVSTRGFSKYKFADEIIPETSKEMETDLEDGKFKDEANADVLPVVGRG